MATTNVWVVELSNGDTHEIEAIGQTSAEIRALSDHDDLHNNGEVDMTVRVIDAYVKERAS